MPKEKYFHQPSVMSAQQHFSGVPGAAIERSRFDRSHGNKLTMNASKLIPIYVDEVLPGDTFSMKATVFARLNTPLRPIMDNLYFETFFFFVPYRLVWDNWVYFMGERKLPTDPESTLTIPQVTFLPADVTHDSLPHYMGIPLTRPGDAVTRAVSALPFRAYYLIFNEWFRDENFVLPRTVHLDDGPNAGTIDYASTMRRGKRHDYFTSCLPWPQKGDPVLIPLVTDFAIVPDTAAPAPKFRVGGATIPGAAGDTVDVSNTTGALGISPAPNILGALQWHTSALIADYSSSAGSTINDLRSAFQIQRLLERDARGGTRYIELILSHFGVQSDDARLQRPEYLGGGSQRINIDPVAATFRSETEGVSQGDLGAVGTVVSRGGFHKSFTEHGVVIGIANVRADLTYQQGLERFWRRQTRYDFYWPALAHLGEQAVMSDEIYYTAGADNTVFGYQERYAEYRYKPSRITGMFNSAHANAIDVWHLSQEFGSKPVLSAAFIEETVPMARVVAVPTEPDFLVDCWFDLKCDRPMPVYSVPGMVDHF